MMLWGVFKEGGYLHHSNITCFISSECNKQVITRLVRAGEWYRPSPRICPRAKALGADTGVAGRYHSPALTSRLITCLLYSLNILHTLIDIIIHTFGRFLRALVPYVRN